MIKGKGKISRRLGCNLWGEANNPYVTRNFPPGQHGAKGHRKVSNWGKQLTAIKKFGYYYNINTTQLNKVCAEAIRLRGDSGENFVGLLEQRLDMVVYRLNFAPTIHSASQLVSHGHILVNGKKVNIRSYRVRAGDIIEVVERSRHTPIIAESVQKRQRPIPSYFETEDLFKGKFIRVPPIADIPYAVIMEPHLVIESQSR